MIKKKINFISIIILPIIFSSCSSVKNASTTRSNSSPRQKFLNGVLITPQNSVGSTASQNSVYNDISSSLPIINTNTSANSLQNKYAEIIGVQPADIDNIQLMQLIDDWYGTPYSYGGDSKDGIDCSAFARLIENKIYNQMLPRTSEEQYEKTKHIKKDDLQEGDLVFFHTLKGSYITHVGVYLLNNKFVHASSSEGVTISNLTDDYWQKTYRAAGRIKDEISE